MPNKYGVTAILALQISNEQALSPLECWKAATLETFPTSPSSQVKGCPKGAFLGMCEEGMISGIPAGSYTTSKDNKDYAMRAVALLQGGVTFSSPKALWLSVMNGNKKAHNSQMDVVLALWESNLIA